MSALPLSVLALAAGVYLLIKVNREYLGGLFKFFAWLVILLSLISTGVTIAHGVHHFRKHRHMEHCEMQGMGNCDMRGSAMSCPEMGHGLMGNAPMGNSAACPMMAGKAGDDSIVLDRAVCEKMMGKDACEKLCKERGKCIMTKDECAKMCGGAATGGMKDCCKK